MYIQIVSLVAQAIQALFERSEEHIIIAHYSGCRWCDSTERELNPNFMGERSWFEIGLRHAMTESHFWEHPRFWASVSDWSQRSQSRLSCPITGYTCEGDLSHLCEDYGCAPQGRLVAAFR